ncbi:hypothetical protein HELRODRAFT_172540 [Helobdella robusta]|uniref:Uncharacterized protein n=1 Tax=Helobdella robusta TaxID=6412 RepID=T1F5H4_HELRO|nr:hypothetical protein HELRODRAFT_172540 [Helobdella robusta]ESO04192.1 hypothetical protein HELRODRAFT_172540 [Helobdella robusta]
MDFRNVNYVHDDDIGDRRYQSCGDNNNISKYYNINNNNYNNNKYLDSNNNSKPDSSLIMTNENHLLKTSAKNKPWNKSSKKNKNHHNNNNDNSVPYINYNNNKSKHITSSIFKNTFNTNYLDEKQHQPHRPQKQLQQQQQQQQQQQPQRQPQQLRQFNLTRWSKLRGNTTEHLLEHLNDINDADHNITRTNNNNFIGSTNIAKINYNNDNIVKGNNNTTTNNKNFADNYINTSLRILLETRLLLVEVKPPQRQPPTTTSSSFSSQWSADHKAGNDEVSRSITGDDHNDIGRGDCDEGRRDGSMVKGAWSCYCDDWVRIQRDPRLSYAMCMMRGLHAYSCTLCVFVVETSEANAKERNYINNNNINNPFKNINNNISYINNSNISYFNNNIINNINNTYLGSSVDSQDYTNHDGNHRHANNVYDMIMQNDHKDKDDDADDKNNDDNIVENTHGQPLLDELFTRRHEKIGERMRRRREELKMNRRKRGRRAMVLKERRKLKDVVERRRDGSREERKAIFGMYQQKKSVTTATTAASVATTVTTDATNASLNATSACFDRKVIGKLSEENNERRMKEEVGLEEDEDDDGPTARVSRLQHQKHQHKHQQQQHHHQHQQQRHKVAMRFSSLKRQQQQQASKGKQNLITFKQNEQIPSLLTTTTPELTPTTTSTTPITPTTTSTPITSTTTTTTTMNTSDDRQTFTKFSKSNKLKLTGNIINVKQTTDHSPPQLNTSNNTTFIASTNLVQELNCSRCRSSSSSRSNVTSRNKSNLVKSSFSNLAISKISKDNYYNVWHSDGSLLNAGGADMGGSSNTDTVADAGVHSTVQLSYNVQLKFNFATSKAQKNQVETIKYSKHAFKQKLK